MFRILALATLFCLAVSSTAAAEERTHALTLDRYHDTKRVERVVSSDKSAVRFSVQPTPIDGGAAVLFEVKAVRGGAEEVRWACVAFQDVAECFAESLRIEYAPQDEKIVFELSVHAQSEAWVRAAKSLQDADAVARHDVATRGPVR